MLFTKPICNGYTTRRRMVTLSTHPVIDRWYSEWQGVGSFVVSLLQKREVSDVWKQGSVFVWVINTFYILCVEYGYPYLSWPSVSGRHTSLRLILTVLRTVMFRIRMPVFLVSIQEECPYRNGRREGGSKIRIVALNSAESYVCTKHI